MIQQASKPKRGAHFIHIKTGSEFWLYRIKTETEYVLCDQSDFSIKAHFTTLHPDDLQPVKKQRQPINKVSESKQKEDRVYNTLRSVFLQNKPACQIKLPGCSIKATEIHHLFSGANRSKYYLVVSEWLAACRNCHDKVHNEMSKDEAIERGFKKIE